MSNVARNTANISVNIAPAKKTVQHHWEKHAHAVSLGNYIKANRSTRYEWGKCDCALFAADGIKAMTGVDIADDFRNKYGDEANAYATIKSVTGAADPTVADAAAHCAKKHGLKELPNPLFAQRGDLVVWADPSGHLNAGLVAPNARHIVAIGEVGPRFISITAVKRAWRVTRKTSTDNIAARWNSIRSKQEGNV